MVLWQVTFAHVNGGEGTCHVEAADADAAAREAWRRWYLPPLFYRVARVEPCDVMPTGGQQSESQ